MTALHEARTEARTGDLFAPTAAPTTPHTTAPQANSLDAAHSVHAAQQNSASSTRRLLLTLLALLAINAALWFGFTARNAVLGDAAEQALQADVAPHKMLLQSDGKPIPVLIATAVITAPAPVPVPMPMPDQAEAPPPAVTPPPSLQANAEAVVNSKPVAAEKTYCMLWEFLSNADIKRAQKRLSDKGWGGYKDELAEEPATFLVYLGPFETRALLDAKLKVIEKMKITDYNVIANNRISLGVLSTEQAATGLVKTLAQRGLTGVEWIERTSGNKRTRYRFDALNAAGQESLNSLALGLGILKPCA